MVDAEAKLLLETGAIESAVIFRRWVGDQPGGWEVHLYPYEDKRLPSRMSNALEKARGGVRTWKSLDRAHEWIAGFGPRVKVSIDEAFPAR